MTFLEGFVKKLSKPFYFATVNKLKELKVAFVSLRYNESFEQLFRRFKKTCEKAAILTEVKKRSYFEKPGLKRKKKSLAARKRKTRKIKRIVF